MNATRYTRRALLSRIGAGAALVPFVPLLEEARAATPPKRFILWFHPTGSVLPDWRPTGTETAWTPSPILAPLEKWKPYLTVVDGVGFRSGGGGQDNPHGQGMAKLWTGSFMRTRNGRVGDVGGYPGGPSVDQVIAQKIGGATKFRSLELRVTNGGENNNGASHRQSYSAADTPVAAERDPYAVFDRVFKDLNAGGAAPSGNESAARLRAERRSVLDLVKRQLGALTPRLGTEDRRKLDAHLEGIRSIEQRLATPPAEAVCKAPSLENERIMNIDNNANLPILGKLMMDMMVAALRCDLTRVSSLMYAAAFPRTTYPFLGVNESHHDISHRSPSQMAARQQLVKVNAWYSEQIAYLLQKLSEVPEGSGTMLDNVLFASCTEISTMGTHDWKSMPFLIAGRAGGQLSGGRFLRFPAGTMHNRLLVSFCQMMGVPEVQTFGDMDQGTGPLSSFAG